MSIRSISELSSGCLVHGSPCNVCKWPGQSTRSRYRSKQIITKTLLVHFSVLEGCGWAGRLFEARHLLTSSVLRTGWALIRGWELNRINTVVGIVSHFIIEKCYHLCYRILSFRAGIFDCTLTIFVTLI